MEVAQAAACIGREFPHALTATLLDHIPAADLEATLARLTGAELVFRRGVPPEATYSFKHALVRDAAYESLLKARRRAIHGRIAAVLENAAAPAPSPELLAFHLICAGVAERALPNLVAAIEQALARAAWSEAFGLIRRGLDVLDGLPDGAMREGARGRLHLLRGQCMRGLHGTASAETAAAYREAREIYARIDARQEGYLAALYGEFLSCLNSAQLDAAGKAAKLLLAGSPPDLQGVARLMGLELHGRRELRPGQDRNGAGVPRSDARLSRAFR